MYDDGVQFWEAFFGTTSAERIAAAVTICQWSNHDKLKPSDALPEDGLQLQTAVSTIIRELTEMLSVFRFPDLPSDLTPFYVYTLLISI